MSFAIGMSLEKLEKFQVKQRADLFPTSLRSPVAFQLCGRYKPP